jgi:hypothetical protein
VKALFVLAIIGCGGRDCPIDKCSGVCIDTTADPRNCGTCGNACTPAASCGEGACACPASFIPATPQFSQQIVRTDVAQLPGLVTGIGLMPGDDGLANAILVAYDPATVPIGMPIDLASAAPTVVRVGFGFDVDPTKTIHGAYLAIRGTLRLDAACDTGVAGTLANADGIEVDLFADFAPVANGCTTTVPAVAFTIGTCP